MKPLLAALALALMAAPAARALDVHQPAVARFISQMVEQHHFERTKLSRLLAGTALDPDVIQHMEAPAEALPWYRYRAIFVTPARIAGGRAFMAREKGPLAAAEKRYGVPPAVVTALIGMESRYGENEGGYSALSALATLAFDYPRRADFFRRELAKYLILCRQNGLDPQALDSSYAGALGAGQFMPSSYLAYAVDSDGGGSDLFASWPDIVASVAHFLAVHGWKRDQPVAARAQIEPDADIAHLVGRRLPIRALRSSGVIFGGDLSDTDSARLVKVETNADGAKAAQYWVGLPNFSVLMSYNNSPLYALAATELAGALATPPAATFGTPIDVAEP